MTYMVEVDGEGRIQLPREVRSALRLASGSNLQLEQEEKEPLRLVLSPAAMEARLVWRGDLPVIEGLSRVSATETLDAIREDRAERDRHLARTSFGADSHE